MSDAQATERTITSLIPARIDRLPWSTFHTMVIVGLGTAWILDGIEVQIVAANGFAKPLHMSTAEVTAAATFYLLGQVLGALFFGKLTDRIGRKKLFTLTLLVYLLGSGIAGLSFSTWFLYVCRFIAGSGTGGEYSAINSAIDELIPAQYRGRVDLSVNGTYWLASCSVRSPRFTSLTRRRSRSFGAGVLASLSARFSALSSSLFVSTFRSRLGGC